MLKIKKSLIVKDSSNDEIIVTMHQDQEEINHKAFFKT